MFSDKYDNKDKVYPNKTKASSDDIVHQEIGALSSDVVQQNIERRKRLPMSLRKINFQTKVIKLTNDFMYNYYVKMLIEKNQ